MGLAPLIKRPFGMKGPQVEEGEHEFVASHPMVVEPRVDLLRQIVSDPLAYSLAHRLVHAEETIGLLLQEGELQKALPAGSAVAVVAFGVEGQGDVLVEAGCQAQFGDPKLHGSAMERPEEAIGQRLRHGIRRDALKRL